MLGYTRWTQAHTCMPIITAFGYYGPNTVVLLLLNLGLLLGPACSM